jgi:hypothetical protein
MPTAIKRLLIATAVLASGVACEAVDHGSQSSTGGDEPRSIIAKERLPIHQTIPNSNLDWVLCAKQWGVDGYPEYCYLGQGGKYMAYGVPNTTSFYFQYFAEGSTVHCGDDTFGDPAPGYSKTCYFANLNRAATQGNTFVYGGAETIAYGGHGAFYFTTLIGSGTKYCTRSDLGFSNEPNSIDSNDCYRVLGGYTSVVSEGETYTSGSSSHTVPYAFGKEGTYYFANIQGTNVSCTASNFGAPSGSGRRCYKLNLGSGTYASENNTFTMSAGYDYYPGQYTSGLDGNVIFRNLGSGTWTCNTSTFNSLDPDWGVTKLCFATGLIN